MLLAALAAAGCTRIETALGRIPFLNFMRSAPFFDPYEAPRPAPAGAVAFESPVGEVLAPIQASEQALNEFGASPRGTNPFPVDSVFLALGDTMFQRHCMVCHGPAGKGDGPIVQTDPAQAKYPLRPPDLTAPTTVARSDGYIYGLIWVGRGLMPAYGPRITHRERWAIVRYVRQLQGTTAGTPPANPPGRAGN
jgi:hypothetical protein